MKLRFNTKTQAKEHVIFFFCFCFTTYNYPSMNGNDLNFNDVELEKERKALNYRDKLKQCKKTHYKNEKPFNLFNGFEWRML